MNRPLLTLALLVLVAVATFAGVKEEVINEHPKFPGKCYDAKRNATYAIGATWNRVREPCTQFSCLAGKERGKFIIKATSCDPLKPPKAPCRIQEGNAKASYPRCCNTVQCPAN